MSMIRRIHLVITDEDIINKAMEHLKIKKKVKRRSLHHTSSCESQNDTEAIMN